jgi:fucose 4-O-acetylase-like acetyltransferase
VIDTASTATARPKTRVPLWDNARFLCVTLVVIGHAIQRLTAEDDHALIVYLFIYAFHMPAFAIISGYFSRPGSPTARQMTRVLTDILLPYLIMETIWTFVQFLVEGKQGFNPSQPSWTLWFLLALGIFRLILPYLALLRWPLAWAVLLSVGVGYMTNIDNTFSLSRAIGILPFFVLGWKIRDWGIVEKWRMASSQTVWIRVAAISVFAAWLCVAWVFVDYWREIDLRFWFFYDDSYVVLGGVHWWAGLVRLGLIVLAVVLSAAFFVLVPRSKNWMTTLGQATMYVYLLHSFVLYPLRETAFLQQYSTTIWLLAVILFAIVVSVLLSTRPVRRVFRPLIEPKPRWLFAHKPRGEHDRAPATGPSRVDPTGSRRR